MSFLDTAGTKITYEVKTIIGVIGIIIGFMLWFICPSIGLITLIIILIPVIALIINNEKVKNNRILGIILILISLLEIFLLIKSYANIPDPNIYFEEYRPLGLSFVDAMIGGMHQYYHDMLYAIIYSIILSIYSLFCAFLLLIKSEHKQMGIVNSKNVSHQMSNKVNMQYNNNSHCPECGGILMEDSKFCPSCGVKIEEKTNNSLCPDCGCSIVEGSKFCSNCGSKLMNQNEGTDKNLPKYESDNTNSDNDEKKLE